MRCIKGLTVSLSDTELQRFLTLQLGLPALESFCGLKLQACPGAAPSATQIFLTDAALAVARCARLRALDLRVVLVPGLGA